MALFLVNQDLWRFWPSCWLAMEGPRSVRRQQPWVGAVGAGRASAGGMDTLRFTALLASWERFQSHWGVWTEAGELLSLLGWLVCSFSLYVPGTRQGVGGDGAPVCLHPPCLHPLFALPPQYFGCTERWGPVGLFSGTIFSLVVWPLLLPAVHTLGVFGGSLSPMSYRLSPLNSFV